MKKQVRLLKMAGVVSLLMGLMMVGWALAASLTVDTFDFGDQFNCAPVLPPFCFGPTSSVVDDGAILGGERDIVVSRSSGSSTVAATTAYTTNRFALQFGDGTVGVATLTWDGNDDNATVLNTALLNIDLTGGNTNDLFVFAVLFADAGNTITIDVYCNATDFSRATVIIPSGITTIGNRVDIHLPFSNFATQGGIGCQPANTGTTNAKAIQIQITGTAGADLTLDLIETTGGRDFGDLPSTGSVIYDATVRGASHIAQGLRLGINVDSEVSDTPDENSIGDDSSNTPDDEDGVTRDMADFWSLGATVDLQVTVNGCAGTCRLNGWIDWNRNGVFTDANEHVFSDNAISNGTNQILSLTVPNSGYVQGDDIYARFRICSTTSTCNDSTTANVLDGEIEDYFWGFGPTAVTLTDLTATPNTNAALAGAAGVLLLGTAFLLFRRSRKHATANAQED